MLYNTIYNFLNTAHSQKLVLHPTVQLWHYKWKLCCANKRKILFSYLFREIHTHKYYFRMIGIKFIVIYYI